MGIKIWVDDLRPRPVGYDVHIKTVDEAIKYISAKRGQIELLDLDHDAGDYYAGGGDYIRILDWMEYEGIDDIPISIHSGNPVGVKAMWKIIQKCGWTYVDAEDEMVCDVII